MLFIYEFIWKLNTFHVTVMCGPRNVPDLWKIQKGRKLYLSVVVIMIPWPEKNTLKDPVKYWHFHLFNYSPAIIEDLLCAGLCA